MIKAARQDNAIYDEVMHIFHKLQRTYFLAKKNIFSFGDMEELAIAIIGRIRIGLRRVTLLTARRKAKLAK